MPTPYTYNAAAQLTTVQSNLNDSNHPPTLLSNVTYNPLGEIEQATLGNGIVRNPSYDNRGRVTSLTDGSIYSYSLGYWSDSNVHTANDSASGNWTYGYDDFNRLSTASETGASFVYDYDQLGNRWGTLSGCTSSNHSACQYTFNSNNQITNNGFQYDRAGNVMNDGIHSYTYDAEGRIIQVDAGQTALYYYDGFGHRVRKIAGGVTRDFLYDLAGHIYQEVDGTIAAKTDLYTPGGFHLGSYADGTTYFSHANWLGTELLRTGPTGSVLWSCSGSLPFGDGASCSGNVGSYVNGISGLRLDFETGLAAAAYRNYSATSGRWLTPDPSGLAAVDPSNPQTWNRYAYVMNNPLSFTDPTGLKTVCDNNGNCYTVVWGNGFDWWGGWSVGGSVGGGFVPPNGPGAGGGNGAANNGKDCTVGSASKLQYAAATAEVGAMTGEFFSGLGPGNLTFGPNSATSQVMAQSGPVQEVLNSYYMTGQTSGLYTFGLPGLVSAGGNPVAQFVGSFRWSITPGNGGINLSLTNTTSFRSLTYDAGPQWQRGSWPTPMGNTHQTYNITATCH